MYFRDHVFLGFTSSFLLHFRATSLCLWAQKRDYWSPLCNSLFWATCAWTPAYLPAAPHRALFPRHWKHTGFRYFPWTMSSRSRVIFSALPSTSKVDGGSLQSTHQHWAHSLQAVLQDASQHLSFCCLSRNSLTLPAHVQLEIHHSPCPSLKSWCLTSLFWCKELPAHSSVSPLEWHTTSAKLCAWWAKRALAMMPHERHWVVCSS